MSDSEQQQQVILNDKLNDSEEEGESFIKEGEAVEVEVNDDDIPMDLDDDDDDEEESEDASNTLRMQEESLDMSFQAIDSHKSSPIYAIASHYDHLTGCLSVVTGGGDDKACLHKLDVNGNLQTTQLSHVHTDSVCCVATNEKFVSDNATKPQKFLAVGGYDGTIVLYDAQSGEKMQLLDGPTDVEFLSFHPNGGSVSSL